MKNTVRTRFAPSPTGFLHVGGLRTALYAYLFAKKNQGQFLLRIEDTDKSREVVGGTENIINALHWAGLFFDEGPGVDGPYKPYIQSQRLHLYQKHAQELIDAGKAYHCFCSSERLDGVRQKQIAAKLPPAYDRHCRDLAPEMVAEQLKTASTHVIRMKVPLDGEMTFNDVIRGNVTIGFKVVDDQVIIKSDGYPTYHLAVVVDDHYMEISHVIRGEEWLPSTPKHLLLYQYFGWQAPVFAHLPLLLNPDRSKLSKRQGDVAVEDYRAKGYLKDALVNFVALLGWNPGDGDTREVFSLTDLQNEFSLERVGNAGAVFNLEKLNWLNHQYIMHKNLDELIELLRPHLAEKGWTSHSDVYVKQVIEIIKERMTVLPDFITHSTVFFEAPTVFDAAACSKNWHHYTKDHLAIFIAKLNEQPAFSASLIEEALKATATELDLKITALMAPLRLTLSGVTQGPALYQFMEILGKEECLKRMDFAFKTLAQQV
jgi:glutamyl-tRNA synthetase